MVNGSEFFYLWGMLQVILSNIAVLLKRLQFGFQNGFDHEWIDFVELNLVSS